MAGMKTTLRSVVFALSLQTLCLVSARTDPGNPAIDMAGFVRHAQETAALRESRRVDEAEFLRLSREPGTVVLDARSARRYAELHLQGAVNLSFPDFTEDSLARVIPTKDTLVLIYCNNNFRGEPVAMALKAAPSALNVSTFTSLHTYGYTNVRELKPLLDVKITVLPLAGTRAPAAR
jgi:rhodanese-related sulfurtransferase